MSRGTSEAKSEKVQKIDCFWTLRKVYRKAYDTRRAGRTPRQKLKKMINS